jgi:hypothetical protein
MAVSAAGLDVGLLAISVSTPADGALALQT